MNAAKVLDDLKRRFPNEPEYHQAVEEVLSTIEEEYNKHPEFDKVNLITRNGRTDFAAHRVHVPKVRLKAGVLFLLCPRRARSPFARLGRGIASGTSVISSRLAAPILRIHLRRNHAAGRKSAHRIRPEMRLGASEYAIFPRRNQQGERRTAASRARNRRQRRL